MKRTRSSGPALPAPSAMVTINVGGTLFYANRQTLAESPPGLLAGLFASGQDWAEGPGAKDAHGNVFICRDPGPFPAVLSYLRTGHALVPPGLSEAVVQLELDYYFATGHVTVRARRRSPLELSVAAIGRQVEELRGAINTMDGNTCALMGNVTDGIYRAGENVAGAIADHLPGQ